MGTLTLLVVLVGIAMGILSGGVSQETPPDNVTSTTLSPSNKGPPTPTWSQANTTETITETMEGVTTTEQLNATLAASAAGSGHLSSSTQTPFYVAAGSETVTISVPTSENVTLDPLIVNHISQILVRDDAETHVEDDSDACVNLSVRVCLQKNCKWFKTECAENVNRAEVGAPFPVPMPNNLKETANIFIVMWTHPPSGGEPMFWLAFMLAALIVAFAIAMAIVLTCCISCIRWMSCLCCRRGGTDKKKEDENHRKVLLVMPEGRKIPVNDFVVDCTGEKPRTRRISKNKNDLFKTFHAVNNSKKKPNWRVATKKEDLERPCSSDSVPNWPYQADQDSLNSSIITATVCRKSKDTTKAVSPSSSKYDSIVVGASFTSENDSDQMAGSSCNYINNAFSMTSIDTDSDMRAPTQFAENEDHCCGVVVDMPPPALPERNKVERGYDVETGDMFDERDSLFGGSQGIYDVPRSIAITEDDSIVKDAQKRHSAMLKLKKVPPPTAPVKFNGADQSVELNIPEQDKEI